MSRWLVAVCAVMLGASCGDCSGEKPAGSEGGPCYGNNTCDDGLACLSALCVKRNPTTDASQLPDAAVADAAQPNDAARSDTAHTADSALPDSSARDVAAATDVATASDTASVGDSATATDGASGIDAAPNYAGRIGSACSDDTECLGGDAFCLYGLCTRSCGAGGTISNCNAASVSNPNGPFGGVYSCFALGAGYISICWPNGTGATCSGDCSASGRADETCIANKCQVAVSGTIARTNMYCHRDSDCAAGESCILFDNLELDNIRVEGICLQRGANRQPAYGSCSIDDQCGSGFCDQSSCVPLCLVDNDCRSGDRCVATGHPSNWYDEYRTQYVGLCSAWPGSGSACSANAACNAGEDCETFETLINNDTQPALAGACRTLGFPSGAAVGAACTADAQCKSGSCLVNPITSLGYCTGPCVGGEADCSGGTSCRLVSVDGRNPATTTDDLRADFCVRTSVGASCFVDVGCVSCSDDGECNPGQGVTCVGAPTGICRDGFGRCADPCRSCTVGGASNGGCPSSTVCTEQQIGSTLTVSYCQDASSSCVRADLPQSLIYADGMCGDVEYPLGGGGPLVQQDLCYYWGRTTGINSQDVFMCGQACEAGVTACPAITTGSGEIATGCRNTYGFGVSVAPGELRAPTQCAPANAYQP